MINETIVQEKEQINLFKKKVKLLLSRQIKPSKTSTKT